MCGGIGREISIRQWVKDEKGLCINHLTKLSIGGFNKDTVNEFRFDNTVSWGLAEKTPPFDLWPCVYIHLPESMVDLFSESAFAAIFKSQSEVLTTHIVV